MMKAVAHLTEDLCLSRIWLVQIDGIIRRCIGARILTGDLVDIVQHPSLAIDGLFTRDIMRKDESVERLKRFDVQLPLGFSHLLSNLSPYLDTPLSLVLEDGPLMELHFTSPSRNNLGPNSHTPTYLYWWWLMFFPWPTLVIFLSFTLISSLVYEADAPISFAYVCPDRANVRKWGMGSG